MKLKRRNKQENGITILALVITIIVLLILAGITIGAITGDNGIIRNAGQAKEETEIANEKEIVEKATVQAMGNNKYGNIEESELQSELDKETDEGKTKATDIGDVIKVLFTESNRNYAVDQDGNVRDMTWWETSDENDNHNITNGEVTLQIGDYITYDANDKGEYSYTAEAEKTGGSGEGQTFSTTYETTWRVLGVEHTSDGDYLMLVPGTPIQSTQSTGLALSGATGYCYGIQEMENVCEIYGYGTGASYARAMTIEDTNKITGYDPMNTGDGTVYGEGTIAEYQNELICTREDYGYTRIQGKNGSSKIFGYTSFVYYDENSKTSKSLAVGESITLISTYYRYYPTTLTEISTGEIKGISTNSREYSILFPYGKSYWLASTCLYGGGEEGLSDSGGTGFRMVNNRVVSAGYMFYAGNAKMQSSCNIMPIVYLDKNIKLEETGNQVNSCTEWKIHV